MSRAQTLLLAMAGAIGLAACSPSAVFIDPTGKTCAPSVSPCPDGWSCVPSADSNETICWPTADAGLSDAGVPDSGPTVDGGVDAGDAGRDAGTTDAGEDGGRDAGPDAGPDGGPDAGPCTIDGKSYPDGTLNPANPCQQCQTPATPTNWTTLPAGSSCGTGKICSGTSCLADCFIGGQLLDAGALDPTNACEGCAPTSSTSAYSNLADGTACGGSNLCASGVCSSVCDIDGGFVPSGQANATNACQVCEPAQSSSGWTLLANGASCASGMVCASGSCASDCFIGTQIVAPNTVDSTNPCQSCQPAAATMGWSNLPNGTTCDGGADLCSSGTCSDVCFIAGSIVPAGQANPANTCQTCQPSQANLGWTFLATGTSCATGKICVTNLCTADCDIGGTIVAPNTVSSNPCQLCLPTQSTTAWSNEPNGLGCGTGEVCSSGSCISGCGIGGTAVAANSIPASNPCVSCQPTVSTTSYTDLANGTACGTGLSCKTGSCCGGTHGTLSCSGTPVDTCLDDLNCGSCGTTCPFPDGCFAGVCQIAALLPVARDSLAAATGPDGKIYAMGGIENSNGNVVTTVEAYDPRTNLWATVAPLQTGVYEMGAAATDAGIFVIGGIDNNDTSEAFGQFLNVTTGIWSKTPNAPSACSDTNPAIGPGGVFFMPGGNGSGEASVLTFAPSGVGAGGVWNNSGPGMTYGADLLASAGGLDGTIYAIGGTNDGSTALGLVQTLAPGAISWGLLANPAPTGRCDLAAVTDRSGLIYAIGGDNCSFSGAYQLYANVEVYDPTAQSWTEATPLPQGPIAYPAVTVGPEGRIYVIGGYDGFNDETYVQVYNPATGNWIP